MQRAVLGPNMRTKSKATFAICFCAVRTSSSLSIIQNSFSSMSAFNDLQRRNDTRVIGRPQAGRRPIDFFVADEVDVRHCKWIAEHNQVNTGYEARRLRQTGVLATREA